MNGSAACCYLACAAQTGRRTDITGIYLAAVATRKRTIRMRCCVLSAGYTGTQLMVSCAYGIAVTERTAVMMVMECVAMMPIRVTCPATMCVPPTRVITPVPRTMPCVPCVAPEPIVDQRSIDVYRLYDIVRAVDIFITHYLHRDLVFLVFLDVY